jgi:hypothetical protein
MKLNPKGTGEVMPLVMGNDLVNMFAALFQA